MDCTERFHGYPNCLRSSNLLEKESHRNLEVVWLTGKLIPGHKTIAINGSEFKAISNKSCNVTERKLKREMKDIEKKINVYLRKLDENDASTRP